MKLFVSVLLYCILSTILGDPIIITDKCEGGESRLLNCHICACTKKDRWECYPYRNKCTSRHSKRGVPIAADLKNTPCAPNDYFKLDCNTCYCNIDKTGYLCTENLCPVVDDSHSNQTIHNNSTQNVTETVPQFINLLINETSTEGGGTSLNVTK